MKYYSIIKMTKNPNTCEFEDAIWHYNYKGYRCLVEFPCGQIRNPESSKLEILNNFN